MMISRSKSSVLCLVALALAVGANVIRAQDNSAAESQKAKEAEQRQELQKKTLALLNEIASGAWGLKLPENRFFVMANAADLLWPFDEKRARTLYWDALNSLMLISPKTAPSENLSKGEQQRAQLMQSYYSTFRLRQRLLRQVARRDSQLALEMLRATRQDPPQLGPNLHFPDDRQLEQEIASEAAARDPSQALQLARQSLASGLTFDVLQLLYRLNQQDSEKASQFAGDIIAKIEATDIAPDIRASIIALSLLESSRSLDGNQPMLSVGTYKILSLEDEQKRTLVDVVTNAALSASANSNLLNQIPEVMPEIERFFPERRAALERKLAAFNQTLTKEQQLESKYNALIRRGIPEELVRTAAATDDETRQSLYRQAAIVAVGRGKTDAFRELVAKELSETGERTRILDYLDEQEIAVAVGRKQLDELRKLLPKIRRKEQRAWAMAELAVMLKQQGNDDEAVTLLDEAATLIKTDLNDDRRTNALLSLLSAYALVDPAKAFALAERTVDQANSQISLLMLLDRVVKSGAVKKSEIMLEQARIMPLNFIVFKYGGGVAALARADFNRTRALADRFDRNELRLMAQLLIVKALLQPKTSLDND